MTLQRSAWQQVKDEIPSDDELLHVAEVATSSVPQALNDEERLRCRVLGKKYRTWTKAQLRDAIIIFPGQQLPSTATKRQHFDRLYSLVNTRAAAASAVLTEPHNQLRSTEGELEDPSELRTSDVEDYRQRTHLTPCYNPDCVVCSDVVSVRLTGPITSDYAHALPKNLCGSCITSSITAQVETRSWNEITCPVVGCDAVFQYEDIKRHASEQIFDRYDNFLLSQALAGAPDYRVCRRDGCQSGGLYSPLTDSFITCATCEKQTCVRCDTEYHPGMSCEEHQQELVENQRLQREKAETEAARAVEEQATEEFLGKEITVKRCPNRSCLVRIEKYHGCDHMTCALIDLPRMAFR